MIEIEICDEETCPDPEHCHICYYCGIKRTHRTDGYCSDKCRKDDEDLKALYEEKTCEWPGCQRQVQADQ